jgi:hypothetical protein
MSVTIKTFEEIADTLEEADDLIVTRGNIPRLLG